MISESVNQQSYIVHQLWDALQKDTADRQPLTQVATWVIGEFGDLLLSNTDVPLKVCFYGRFIFDIIFYFKFCEKAVRFV